MAIYRGIGGAGDSTTDATVTAVTEKAVEAAASAASASTSETNASNSASAASTSATNASNSASNASTSETNASNSASAASTSASNASTSETNAAASASAASTSETNAAASESAASTSETNAATSETNAATSESNAASSASAASTSASNAATSESNASTSETNAATSAANAATSETNAGNSATAAASSASSASTSASTATTKASEASTSATNAATSETNAATSETNAASSASSASTSASTATTKASEASTSATNAATSATNASNSASAASTSATNAATSETNAQTAADTALSALDNFDDRYLGQKASDPTLDNDGDALVAGALYFNTTDDVMKVYDGSVWVAAYASLSGTLVAVNNLSDLTDVSASRTNLGLGTAATTASTDYATAAQGALADSALQNLVEDTTPQLGGDLASNGNDINFGDGDKANFGADSDLQIYHTGGASVIRDSGTGSLYIDGSSEIFLRGQSGFTNMIKAIDGAEVQLYHNNAPKLETTATGVDVTGTITADGLTTSGDINFGDNDKANFGVGSDLQIYHDAGNSLIVDNGTGDLYIRASDNFNLQVGNGAGGWQDAIRTYDANRVDISHAGSVKLSTTATGVDVTGTVTADGLTLSQSLTIGTGGTYQAGSIYSDSNWGMLFRAKQASPTGADFKWANSSDTEHMRIDSSGNVGIGTTSFNYGKLELAGSGYVPFAVRSTDGVIAYLAANSSSEVRMGAISNHPLSIRTNGAERMRIDSNGNVGIGTSSPSSKLQVQQNQAGYTYSDFVNTTNGGGVIQRLIVRNIANTGTTSVDFAKLIGSGLAINNYDTNAANFTSFGVGSSERMRLDSSGNLKFNSGYGSVATAYGCRAWIKFNGAGTVLIYNSANVSSIVDLAVGRYSVNFTTAMVDADYAAIATNSNKDGGCYLPSTTSVNVFVGQAAADSSIISVAIFR